MGVSKENQWIAAILARAGFQVHIVTNAEEVEPSYRCLDWSPSPLIPSDCPGSIQVHPTDQAKRRHYVPYANPFVTKLAALATEVIRTFHCDLIYSSYLELYAVAAFLAARWTGVPYGVRHAGSDVGILFQSPELQTTYREVMLAADYLVTTPATYRRFLHLGVPQDRLYFSPGSSLPPELFSPEATPLEVNALLTWMRDHLPADPYYEVFRRFLPNPFRPDLPTIGIYGKIGAVKGSFDLIHALGRLKREGVAFQWLALTQGSTAQLTAFASLIEAQGLTEVTWLLPFLPHWEIPHFLRACTAVCFLERDFPIPIHTPLIPQEMFACGICAVLSREIAEKHPLREQFRQGSNVFLVDPRNHEELAETLRTILSNPPASRQIGQQGFADLSCGRDRFASVSQGWQQLFPRIVNDIQQRRQMMSLADMQAYLAHLYTDDVFRQLFTLAPEASFAYYRLTEREKHALQAIDHRLLEYFATSLKMKQQEYLRATYPATFALPASLIQPLFQRFYHHYPVKPHEEISTRLHDFGIFLEQMLELDELAPGYASEVVRYERLHYRYTYEALPEDAFTELHAQHAPDRTPLGPESRPLLLPGVSREIFTYPIVSLVEALRHQQAAETLSAQPEKTELIFQREPHSLTLHVFTLNPETALLLDHCQGVQTIAEVIERIEQQLGEADLTSDIFAMLSLLQDKQIIGVQHA